MPKSDLTKPLAGEPAPRVSTRRSAPVCWRRSSFRSLSSSRWSPRFGSPSSTIPTAAGRWPSRRSRMQHPTATGSISAMGSIGATESAGARRGRDAGRRAAAIGRDAARRAAASSAGSLRRPEPLRAVELRAAAARLAGRAASARSLCPPRRAGAGRRSAHRDRGRRARAQPDRHAGGDREAAGGRDAGLRALRIEPRALGGEGARKRPRGASADTARADGLSRGESRRAYAARPRAARRTARICTGRSAA